MRLTEESFWEKFWGGDAVDITTGAAYELHPLMEKYLPKATASKPLDIIEIGCYPGRFLYYFATEFSYRPSGIDFLPQAVDIPNKLGQLGVEAQVFVADIFKFQPRQQYDVVFSKGFVEHFSNWQEVLQIHLDLLKPGGTLVIDFPNYRYGQYWVRWLIDPNFAEGHCLEVMDPEMWSEALEAKGYEILYSGYFLTFQIWIDSSSPAAKSSGRKLPRALFACAYALGVLLQKLKINFPHRYFSPYGVVIAKKPE